VAIIAEGKTDFVVLCAAIESLLQGQDFEPVLVQPDYPAGAQPGPTGEGWGGVYRWCQQARRQGGGRVGGAPIVAEVIVIHLDADVADKTYRQAHLVDPTDDLPCARPCPPASDTTDALRAVVLRWTGEQSLAEGFIFCTPSKSMETWVLAALFPNDAEMQRQGWECHGNPDGRLAASPKSRRVAKSERDYRDRSDRIRDAWPDVRKRLDEAERFSREFESVPAVRRSLSQSHADDRL